MKPQAIVAIAGCACVLVGTLAGVAYLVPCGTILIGIAVIIQ